MIVLKEKKYFDDKWFQQILLLLDNKKIARAMEELAIYLESYPYDLCARTGYASLLLDCGRVDEAEWLINGTIITKRTTDRSIYELIKVRLKLLCEQRKYEECYKLFMENDSLLKSNLDDYYSVLVFLKMRLSLPIMKSECCKSYSVEQMISYSEERAIEHIKKHVDNFDSSDASCFSSDFPVEEVYYKLRNILPINTEVNLYSGMGKNYYIFKCDGNGRAFRKIINYIKVICIQDTNDILTMFPYNNKYNLPYTVLDLELDKSWGEEKPNTKRLSQIDKFNQRYNK